MTVSMNINARADIWTVGDLGMEDGNATILPNTDDTHRFTFFEIILPTGSGDGALKLQNHYYDVNAHFGYPPYASIEMKTNSICDFSVDITVEDDWEIEHKLFGGAEQSYSMYERVVLQTMNTFWIDAWGTMWVCDDVGYGTVGEVWYD